MANSSLHLMEGVCRGQFRYCHQTGNLSFKNFSLVGVQNMSIKLRKPEIRKSSLHSLVKVILT